MNKFQPKKTPNTSQWTPQTLPIDQVIAIYARQSTKNQVQRFVQSGEMQTDDLMTYARRLGWDEDHIILFQENIGKDGQIKHASGKLRIDQREGLQALVEQIEADLIKAVMVFLEDRLFRDETQIQVNVFIDICKQHHCVVITPHMTYDFANPFHVKQFRWRCEEAADFLRDYIITRLNGAKNRVSEKGLYDGRPVPFGFIIDRRKTIIVSGSEVPNPTYNRFIEYPPHAEVVRRIFSLFVKNGSRVRSLHRQLRLEPVLFPAFPDTLSVKEVGKRCLKKAPGGYHISRHGLSFLLTNVVYIGGWLFHGTVAWNNHPAIVEEDVFWFAFNRLSAYTTEGEENTQRAHCVRFTKGHNPQALLKDCIEAADPTQVVYTSHKFDAWYYTITGRGNRLDADAYHIVTMQVTQLDSLFTAKLFDHLQHSDSYTHYQQLLEKRSHEAESAHNTIERQLSAIEQECNGLMLSLAKPTLPQPVRIRLEARMALLLTNQEELSQKQATLTAEHHEDRVVKLHEYAELVGKLSEKWAALSFVKRRTLVEALVRHVSFASLAPHWLELTIEWDNPTWGIDTCLIWRSRGTAPFWNDADDALVRELFPQGDGYTLMEKLPHRSWSSIQQRAFELGVKSTTKSKLPAIPRLLSLQDWQYMEEHGICPQMLSEDIQAFWSCFPVPPNKT